MGPLSHAEARSRGYGLLGQLILRGLRPEDVATLKQTPLAAHLPAPLDLDALAAQHHRLLSLEIHPYASLFLSPEPGALVDPILDACRSAGFHVDAASARPDHLGIALMMLSFLCGATADALADGEDAIAERTEALAQSFLSAWLVPWLAPLRAAVHTHTAPADLWRAVLDTASALAEDHWAGAGTLELPEPPPLLDEARTDLRTIATFLLAPAHAGVYLSRADLGGLARGVRVPRGLGGREQELTNLLRAAAEYGEVPALMARIDALLAERADLTHGPHAEGWRARIAQTRTLVRQIAAQAAEQTAAAASPPAP